MRIHEQIYTSATELLAAGQSDLGVVAQSVGFPRKLAAQLSSLSSYRLLEEKDTNDATKHPARIIAMPREDGSLYCISRIVFAGADHSGRNMPLAHHVLLSIDDLKSSGNELSDVVLSLRSHFINRWEGSPKVYDPPRALIVERAIKRLPSVGSVPSNRFASVLGRIASTSDIWTASNAPAIVFILPDDAPEAGLELLSSLFTVLAEDNKAALSFQSHVTSSSDLIGSVSVVATYNHSGYLAEIMRRPEKRRPMIFDLTAAEFDAPKNIGFASWFETQSIAGASTNVLNDGLLLHRRLDDIDEPSYPAAFTEIWKLGRALQSVSFLSQVDEITNQISSIRGVSDKATELLSRWGTKAIGDHIARQKKAADWPNLVRIAVDSIWPRDVRHFASSAIYKHLNHSLPSILSDQHALGNPNVIARLSETIESGPDLWVEMLHRPSLQGQCREFLENRLRSGHLNNERMQRTTELLVTSGDVTQQYHAATIFLESAAGDRRSLHAAIAWLQSLSFDEAWFQGLHDSGTLSRGVADAVNNFLHPPEPTRPRRKTRIGRKVDQIPSGLDEPSQKQASNFASRHSATRTNVSRSVKCLPTVMAIAITLLAIALLVLILIGILDSYEPDFAPRIKVDRDPMTIFHATVAGVFGCISLLIGIVAAGLFKWNRNVRLHRGLMLFGYASAVLMTVSMACVVVLLCVLLRGGR